MSEVFIERKTFNPLVSLRQEFGKERQFVNHTISFAGYRRLYPGERILWVVGESDHPSSATELSTADAMHPPRVYPGDVSRERCGGARAPKHGGELRCEGGAAGERHRGERHETDASDPGSSGSPVALP